MTFLKLEQFMKILYPDSISGYPDIRILYPDIRILYPKLVCFGYHFLENLPFSLHYCYVKITIFHPVVSKIKLRFYLKPGNREYPYSSVGMRAAAIIAMCRTLCPYSPAHKILGNRTTYFSTTHACFQISRKLARCETNS